MAEVPWHLVLDDIGRRAEALKRKKTNADRVRSMTDEELASWVTSGIKSVLARCKGYELSPAFEQEMLDWLRQEAK